MLAGVMPGVDIAADAQTKKAQPKAKVAKKTSPNRNAKTTSKKITSSKMKEETKPEQTAVPDTTDAIVEIVTSEGPIKVLLYGDTPVHRDNFLKHVNEHYYDGTLFHRVIKDFMVQAGDPNSKDAAPGAQLGSGDPGYTLPAEINYPKHYHKYGALAAARTADQVNPERRSSGSQFYIVTGNKVDPRNLKQLEDRMANDARMTEWRKLMKENAAKIKELQAAGDKEALEAYRQQLIAQVESSVKVPELPEQLKKDYIELGGAPHLDGQYTVFGEVLEGMDVVEKIQNAATDRSDRPTEDIKIISTRVLPAK